MGAVRTVDVVVLGGGPAGSMAARRAALCGLEVVLLERSGYRQQRVGECLPPRVAGLFDDLGLGPPPRPAVRVEAPGVMSRWSRQESAAAGFGVDPEGHGWNVDRRRFDAMLARVAGEAGVELRRRTRVVAAERRRGRWSLQLRGEGSPDRLGARFVIDATGRSAWLARRQGVRWRRRSPLVALYAHLRNPLSDRRIWLESCEHGWWYAAPLPEGRLVAVHLTDGDLLRPGGRAAVKRLFGQRLRQTTLWRQRRVPTTVRRLRLAPAAAGRLERFSSDSWLAVGDAAAATEPLGGTGVCRALEWGDRGGLAAVAALAGGGSALVAYEEGFAAQFRAAVLSQTAQYSLAWSQWPGSIFWRRRREALRDAIAELMAPVRSGAGA